MVKKLFIILGIIGGILVALVVCVVITMELGLYLPSISDQELVESAFSEDNPGYVNIEIISSQGEGIRRIPRTLEVVVQMESYPQTVTCQGEVFFIMGDPSAVNVRWRTLECAGHHHYIELAQAVQHNGFEYSECHDEKISLLLARWVKLGLIGIDDLIYPEVNDAVAPLAANPDLLTLQPALDAGLFDTANIIVRADVKSDTESSQGPSIVLRCDGSVEFYKMSSWLLNKSVDISYNDYVLPETLEPFNPLTDN
jgi:hypothetical protein